MPARNSAPPLTRWLGSKAIRWRRIRYGDHRSSTGLARVNFWGLSAEDGSSARALVRLLKGQSFAFVKTYDRLTPEAYSALADEARKAGIRVEGHVPLSLSPAEAVRAGQSLIDHLTLVLEACIPGTLDQGRDLPDPMRSERPELSVAGSDVVAVERACEP